MCLTALSCDELPFCGTLVLQIFTSTLSWKPGTPLNPVEEPGGYFFLTVIS